MQILTRLRERLWPAADPASLALNRHSLPLDGVRGLAVLLVLCYDCLKLLPSSDPLTFVVRKVAASGWVGVDLFFVLSGFLITGILLETRGQVGYWKSFLLRRAVRIFPLYYATLIGLFLVVPAVLQVTGLAPRTLGQIEQVRGDHAWYWFYGQNWMLALQGHWPADRLLNHFWSLAVEEQFYLVWPLVVAFLPRRALGWCCGSLIVFSLTLRVCLWKAGAEPVIPYVMTITRLDSLCSGGLLAIALRSAWWRERLVPKLPALCLMAVVGLLAVDQMWTVLLSESPAAITMGHTLIAVTFAALIGAAAVVPQRHLLARIFSLPGLTTLGKYSYAIYVFHRFVFRLVIELPWEDVPLSLRGPMIFAFTLLGSLVVARVSWIVLEHPFLRLKDRFPRPDEAPKVSRETRRVVQPSDAARPTLEGIAMAAGGISEKS